MAAPPTHDRRVADLRWSVWTPLCAAGEDGSGITLLPNNEAKQDRQRRNQWQWRSGGAGRTKTERPRLAGVHLVLVA
jgi:hypothetical protein